MKQRILLYYLIALLLFPLCKVQATHQPEFSTAGFYQLANSGRDVFSMNPAWRLHKGAAPGAEACLLYTSFDISGVVRFKM